MKNFDNILFIKDRNGLTNIQMGNLINISDSMYSRYEKGTEIMPLKHINTYSNIFNVSIDFLFGFTKKNNYIINSKDINLDILSQRLKKLRAKNNITQKELATKIKLSNFAISKYETKKVLISTIALYKICAKYHISADYLLGKTNFPIYIE